jgi:hypothetical protein
MRKEEAPAFILGYTCGNDIRGEGSWSPDIFNWRKKGSDTFRFHGHQVPLDDSCTTPPRDAKKKADTGNRGPQDERQHTAALTR